MQPVRTPPEVSALLLLPEAADVTAREAAAITARHASRFEEDNRSMTKAQHSLWDRSSVTSSDQVTGLVTRLRSERDLERYHSHTHTSFFKTAAPPWRRRRRRRRGRKPGHCCHGSGGLVGRPLWPLAGSCVWPNEDQSKDQPRLCCLLWASRILQRRTDKRSPQSLTGDVFANHLRNEYSKFTQLVGETWAMIITRLCTRSVSWRRLTGETTTTTAATGRGLPASAAARRKTEGARWSNGRPRCEAPLPPTDTDADGALFSYARVSGQWTSRRGATE